jgi:predicted DNA-binding WGR domain protein
MSITLKKTNIYLELVNRDHHKFYQLVQENNIIRITYGRIGWPGKIKIINFPAENEAFDFFNRQLLKKFKRGYRKAIKGLTPPKIKSIHPGQLRINFIPF